MNSGCCWQNSVIFLFCQGETVTSKHMKSNFPNVLLLSTNCTIQERYKIRSFGRKPVSETEALNLDKTLSSSRRSSLQKFQPYWRSQRFTAVSSKESA